MHAKDFIILFETGQASSGSVLNIRWIDDDGASHDVDDVQGCMMHNCDVVRWCRRACVAGAVWLERTTRGMNLAGDLSSRHFQHTSRHFSIYHFLPAIFVSMPFFSGLNRTNK
jgi:hypothetical protein